MNTYFLRCVEKDKGLLEKLATKLGLLTVADDGALMPTGCTWDVIGYLHVPTGEVVEVDGVEQPVTAIKCNILGEQYWHINMSIEGSLGEIAEAIYKKTGDGSLGMALRDMSRFFVTDEQGKPATPINPARVFL